MEEGSGSASVSTEECRICCGTTSSLLVAPCKCRGTMRYVHEECFIQWAQKSNSLHCEVCFHHIRLKSYFRSDAPLDEKAVPLDVALWSLFKSRCLPWFSFLAPLVFHILSFLVRTSSWWSEGGVGGEEAEGDEQHLLAISKTDEVKYFTLENILRLAILTVTSLMSHRCWRDWRSYCMTKVALVVSPPPTVSTRVTTASGPTTTTSDLIERAVLPMDEMSVLSALTTLQEKATSSAEKYFEWSAGPMGLVIASAWWASMEIVLHFLSLGQSAMICAITLFSMHHLTQHLDTVNRWRVVTSFVCLVADFSFVVGLVPIYAGLAVVSVSTPFFTIDETCSMGADPSTIHVFTQVVMRATSHDEFYPMLSYWMLGLSLTVLCTILEFGVIALLIAPGVNLLLIHVREERAVDGDLWGALYRDFITVPTWKCLVNGLRSVSEDVALVVFLVQVPLTVWSGMAPAGTFPIPILPFSASLYVCSALLALALLFAMTLIHLPMDVILCRALLPLIDALSNVSGLRSYIIQSDRREALIAWLGEWSSYLEGDGIQPGEVHLPPPDSDSVPISASSPNNVTRVRPKHMATSSFHLRRFSFILGVWIVYVCVFLGFGHMILWTERVLGAFFPSSKPWHSVVLHFVLLAPHVVSVVPWKMTTSAFVAAQRVIFGVLQVLLLIIWFSVWITFMVAKAVYFLRSLIRFIAAVVRLARTDLYYKKYLVMCGVIEYTDTSPDETMSSEYAQWGSDSFAHEQQ
eukprot:PhF_6_TR2298/c0_g1_i3/m.4033